MISTTMIELNKLVVVATVVKHKIVAQDTV